MRLFTLILAMIAGLAAPALAEPEVHIVGIYEGFDRSNGQIHGPKARVLLDRPGAEVVLVLSSYEATLWEVTLGEGTMMPSVVLSQLMDDRQGEVVINGERLDAPIRMDVPLAYQPEGRDFRALVAQVPDLFGVERMASFTGDYGAGEEPFQIADVVDDPRYGIDRLKALVTPDIVPDSLRPLIGPDAAMARPEVQLTDAGFEVAAEEGVRLIALPLEMPGISWPMGAVRDAETGTLYGVTRGGEGFLYAYDEAKDSWRIVRSMEQMDAQALFLDEKGRRLIMPLGLDAAGRIAILDLKAGEAAPLQMVEFTDGLVGLNDLYDPGNGPAPTLRPLGIDGDQLLLMATSDRHFASQDAFPGQPAPVWRAWLVDLSSAQAALVGYGDGGPPEN